MQSICSLIYASPYAISGCAVNPWPELVALAIITLLLAIPGVMYFHSDDSP